MQKVTLVKVDAKDADCRLDRWFKRYYPELRQGMLQRLLRGKNIRVNGLKAAADYRLKAGDEIRIPPMDIDAANDRVFSMPQKDIDFIQSLVIYKDDDVIVLNKPSGIAVQGGSKTVRHIDGMLDGLRFGKDRPKLVHRLDKETSGVLLLARTPAAAAFLGKAFQSREADKVYWAVVAGKPELEVGKIKAALSKRSGCDGYETMQVDEEHGQKASTVFHVVDSLLNKVSWLEMMPLTGRTHQLRVHSAYMGTPILGDDKYGKDVDVGQEIPRLLLHAKALRIPHPRKGVLEIEAPISLEMKKVFDFFGFDARNKTNSFAFFDSERECT